MMLYEEKLDLVVKAIIDAKKFTLGNDKTKLYINEENRLIEFFPQDLNIILIKLQDEEKVIKTDISHEFDVPERDITEAIYHSIVVLDNFNQWQAIYWEKRKKSAKESVTSNQRLSESGIEYTIVYTPAREILVNGILLSKPDFDSENERVFSYLYEHPNNKITVVEIERETGNPLTKDFDKIIENLGFKGDLRKAFFNVSKNTILFRNHITKHELEQMGITRLRLR
jgi:hypothetical protein